MKAGKYILYAILTFLIYINVFNIYFSGGINPFTFTTGYMLSMAMPFITVFFMWLGMLLVFLSYIYPRILVKKNLLRINLIILIIFIISSLIARVMELIDGVFYPFTWSLTLLYIALLVMNILIMRDLYNLIQELFLKKTDDF